MRIESIKVAFPAREVSNEEVVKLIASSEKSEHIKDLVRKVLERSGASTRFWRTPGETAISITKKACQQALSEATGPVDLIISASVHSDFYEPCWANPIACELGISGIEAFDMKAACDGWMKAAKVAQALMQTGSAKRVLIVNGEFPMTEGGGVYPELFEITEPEALEYTFPGFTLGETAAATILSAAGDDWQFANQTENHLVDCCTAMMPWAHPGDYSFAERLSRCGPGNFTSYGRELLRNGFPSAVKVFNESVDPGNTDHVFTHCSSKTDWENATCAVGAHEKWRDMYAEYGNLVSAAVPAGIALAAKEGRLKRGHHVAAWVASAGMSFSTATFTY